MQAIFGFGGDALPDWDETVLARFPPAAELTRPWRWINATAPDLGEWLLAARESLSRGEGVDLATRPGRVQWVRLDGHNDDSLRRRAAMTTPPNAGGSVVVIGDSRRPDSQRLIAGQTPGAVTVEAVDLRDFVAFAATFDARSPDSLAVLLDFAGTLMVNADIPGLKARLRTLERGTAHGAASEAESACIDFRRAPSHRNAAAALASVAKRPRVRIYRPAVYFASIRALEACDGSDVTFHQHAVRQRERFRMTGRNLPSRAVGSTLLLKGLEADVAVILDADALDARNLYVALTRGARKVVVCSASQVLCG